jgi:hypothetical protein
MIQIKENQLDLGTIKVQTERFFSVTLQNPTDKSVIVVVKPSCSSCTFMQSGPPSIPPMGEGYYTFLYRPDVTGQMVRSIHFLVDDKIEATFVFKANVV